MERIDASPKLRLALITLKDRSGGHSRTVDVRNWPLTLGRSLDQDLVLDDPSVAPHHLKFDVDPSGQPWLHVGETVNGVWLDGQHVTSGEQRVISSGASKLTVGNTDLTLRTRAEALAPEQPLTSMSQVRPGQRGVFGPLKVAWRGVLMALGIGALLAESVLISDPDASFLDWLVLLLAWPMALLVWSGCWALLSKVFHHRLDFSRHFLTALLGLALIEMVSLSLGTLGASLGWPNVWRMREPVEMVMWGWLVYRHLALVTPRHLKRAAAAVGSLVLLLGGTIAARTHETTDRWLDAPFMGTLPPSWLNATRSVSVDRLVDELAPVATGLQERVQKAKKEGDAPEGAEDD